MNAEQIANALRHTGFKATKQRIALFTHLTRADRPLQIQEIADAMGRTMDTATVYRMIDAFKKAGLVREVNLRGELPRYELSDEHDHHHIVCTDCGHIEDFTDETHERVGKKVLARSKAFSKITGHSFDLYGLCKTCAK